MSPTYGFIPLLFLAAIAVGVVVGVALVLLRHRRPVRQEPSCGKCGYVVTGLPSFTCPECGSDLREVGILIAESRRPLSPLVKGIIWTIAFPLPALVLSSVITALGLHEYTETRNYIVGPNSGAYAKVAMIATAKGPNASSLKSETLVLQLATNGTPSAPSQTSELTIDPATHGYRYVGKGGKPIAAPNGLDAHIVLDWLEAAGIDGGRAAVQKEASELFAQSQAISAANYSYSTALTPSFNTRSSWMQGAYGSPLWWTITQLILWPLLWLLGLWRLTRRRAPRAPAPNAELPRQSAESV